MSESALDRAEQGEFFEPTEIELAVVRQEESRNPTFTAERFFQKSPGIYKLIVLLHVNNISIAELARRFGVSRNTVARIILKEISSKTVEQLRAQCSAMWRLIAHVAGERVMEVLLDPNYVPNANHLFALNTLMGTATDKAELLSGGATSRVAVLDENRPKHEDYFKLLGSLSMGSGAEISPTKGPIDAEFTMSETNQKQEPKP